jgi:hypothetical protein
MVKLKKPALLNTEEKREEPKQAKEKKGNLPPDEYKNETEEISIVIDDSRQIRISVKRTGELGLPHVDIRQYQTTEVYKGYTKKGIMIPTSFLADLIEELQNTYEACQEKGLLEEEAE